MIRMLQSSWLTALIGGLLYLGVTLALFRPGSLPPREPAAQAHARSATAPVEASWKFRNPEFNQWIEDIKRQKDVLALREQQLKELQSRLETERQELRAATQTIHQLQSEFDRNVVRIQSQDYENLKRQAKLVSGMSPETAASLINEMPEDEAVRILYTMKPDDASAVLESLSKIGRIEARRAASFTERIRHLLPPEIGPRPKSSP
jgi:flagellar motility protein MotE (MotC chaperone)